MVWLRMVQRYHRVGCDQRALTGRLRLYAVPSAYLPPGGFNAPYYGNTLCCFAALELQVLDILQTIDQCGSGNLTGSVCKFQLGADTNVHLTRSASRCCLGGNNAPRQLATTFSKQEKTCLSAVKKSPVSLPTTTLFLCAYHSSNCDEASKAALRAFNNIAKAGLEVMLDYKFTGCTPPCVFEDEVTPALSKLLKANFKSAAAAMASVNSLEHVTWAPTPRPTAAPTSEPTQSPTIHVQYVYARQN